MFVHRQKHLNSSIGFASGDIPLGDDSESSRTRADPAGTHSGDEGPEGLVVPQTAGDVDGVVVGGGRVSVGGVAVEGVEELEGFGSMVPQPLEGFVNRIGGPVDIRVVKDPG